MPIVPACGISQWLWSSRSLTHPPLSAIELRLRMAYRILKDLKGSYLKALPFCSDSADRSPRLRTSPHPSSAPKCT